MTSHETQLSLTIDPSLKTFDGLADELNLPDAEIVFWPHFFTKEEGDTLFDELMEGTKWNQETIKSYGREVKLPRLTAWYGDKGASYTYSNIANNPNPWTSTLLHIKTRIDQVAAVEFNSVLLNLYRDGNDAVSWHQDNESELGENPTIASVSLGATRRFQFRHKFKKELPKADLDLTHGSLLIMKGTTQQFWQHQIARTAKPVDPRINLTFRVIHPDNSF